MYVYTYVCVYVCMYVCMYISESLGWLTVCEQRGEVFDEEEPMTHVVLFLPQTRPLLGRPRRQRGGLCVAGGREGGRVGRLSTTPDKRCERQELTASEHKAVEDSGAENLDIGTEAQHLFWRETRRGPETVAHHTSPERLYT